jgi:hypothetical protein
VFEKNNPNIEMMMDNIETNEGELESDMSD